MVTDTSVIPQVTHAEPPLPDTLPTTNRVDISMLSPSARTSFTRVDTMVNDEDDAEDISAEQEGPEEPAAEDEAVDDQAPPPEVPLMPQVSLTFLLVSGKRRSMTFEPETTVGRTKELVWNAWPKGAYAAACLTVAGVASRYSGYLYLYP